MINSKKMNNFPAMENEINFVYGFKKYGNAEITNSSIWMNCRGAEDPVEQYRLFDGKGFDTAVNLSTIMVKDVYIENVSLKEKLNL